MIARALTITLLLCLGVHIQAQVIATTEEGRKVILKKDGTWMYLEDYTKSLTGAKPDKKKGKAKDKKAAPTPEAAPVEKKVTMADIQCGDILKDGMNPQTQEATRELTEAMVITEKDDPKEFKFVLGVNSSKTYTWDMQIQGQKGCATETPTVRLTFEDGKIMTLKVANDYVCDRTISLFLSKGLGNKNDLKTLRSKAISRISVETKQGAVEEELSPLQAATLQKAFNCLNGK